MTLYFEVELRSERRPGTEQKTSLGFTTPPKRLSLFMGMAETALLLDLDRDTGPVETDPEAACGCRGYLPSPARPQPSPRPGEVPRLAPQPRFPSFPENSVAHSSTSCFIPVLGPSLSAPPRSPRRTRPASQSCASAWSLLVTRVLCGDSGEIVTLSALSIRGQWAPDEGAGEEVTFASQGQAICTSWSFVGSGAWC